MARSRSRRRRQGVIVLIALLVTATVFVFARDLRRYAHGTTTQQASLNRSFKSLSGAILRDENRWGEAIGQTMATGSTLTRAELAARFDQYRLMGAQFEARAAILARPTIHDSLQMTLIAVTNERVSAVDRLLGAVSVPLGLPGSGPEAPVAAIQAVLVRANAQWRAVRLSLRHEPGGVTLERSRLALATAPLQGDIAALLASPTLAASRAVTISAVSVEPAPLPAAVGVLHLVPTSIVAVGVSVSNLEWANEHVTITVVVRPANGVGRAVSRARRVAIGPSASVAVMFASLAVAPGEAATMTVSVVGAPASPTGATRSYQLVIAPSPTH